MGNYSSSLIDGFELRPFEMEPSVAETGPIGLYQQISLKIGPTCNSPLKIWIVFNLGINLTNSQHFSFLSDFSKVRSWRT